MSKLSFLLSILLYPLSVYVNAQVHWIYGEAAVAVKDAPLDKVRVQAIKNAVADAAFQSGAMISAEEVLLNGVLVGSSVSIKANGEVNRVEVIDEELDNGLLTVWVKVDMQNHDRCDVPRLGPSVLVSQFGLDDMKQAVFGGIQELGAHVSKRIEQQLQRENPKTRTQILPQRFANASELAWAFTEEQIEKATLLSRSYGYQYLIFGSIRDISLFSRKRKTWLSEDVQTQRNFTLRVYVLDVFNQSIVVDDSYHTSASWEFDLYSPVDLNSGLFWQSAYGRSVLNTLNSVVQDVKATLNCRQTLAQVVAVTSEEVIINIGARQGVRSGELFSLQRPSAKPLTNSRSPAYVIPQVNSALEVIQVNADSAILRGKNIGVPSNARMYDLVRELDTQDSLAEYVSQH
ncbi:flagellar assembly protein T N-terminal domain-containing protein [Bowmanella denitrificans]|uniref:flagellar assembly protein T N-terminal domain-containing protein n=1 Tax=Bowmanella denitrificans TaxID=366582 RepID=UPI000C9C9F47|nr:flagellar assembly protein T N-terminal domain-containing protein [Bowmanella denitrificans]